MKIRLAKKITKQQPDNCLSLHKTSLYWLCAWNRYNNYVHPSCLGNGKLDHRIDKAVTMMVKYDARIRVKRLIKSSYNRPFKKKDLVRLANKLFEYGD